jgi:spore maturation protein SpmB
VTVATEAVLFVPLSISVHRYIGEFNWLGFAIRPTLAAVAMGAVEIVMLRFGVIPALLAGLVAYAATLIATGAIGRREAEIARTLLGRTGTAVSQP